MGKVAAQPEDRVPGLLARDLCQRAIAARVVGSSVRADAVGDWLDQCGPKFTNSSSSSRVATMVS